MKKLISLTLAVVLALSVVACGGQNTREPETNNAGTIVNTPTQEQVPEKPESEQRQEEETPPAAPDEKQGEDENKDESQSESEQPNEDDEQPEASEEDPVSFSASHSDVTLKAAGNSFRLTAEGNRDEYVVTYSSDNKAVAVVDVDGNVTAVAPGNTIVTMHVEVTNESATIEYEFTCIVRCSWIVQEDSTGGENNETEEETPAEEAPSASVDLAAFFTNYIEKIGVSMMPVEGELLDVFYAGLSSYSCKQSVVYMAAMSAVPFEFALIEVENTEDADAVRAILQSRVDYQADGGAWYPETIAAWEKAEVLVIGNYVAMIVAGEMQSDAVEAFKGFLVQGTMLIG